MLFFGLFILVVLPLFLIYSAGLVAKNPDLRHTAIGGIIRFVLYLFAGMSLVSLILVIERIFKLI